MEIKTLTKKQIKSTLSEKKSKTKEVIKNILATPYENSFWPVIPSENEPKFKTILEKNLPLVKIPKTNVPWKEIKNLPKSERKKFRLEYAQRKNARSLDSSKSQGLILGINDVTKALEQNSLSTVLISNDVHPKLMVQHVLDMTVIKNVPTLIIPNLRNLTKTHCGINSVILGIQNNVPGTNSLSEIQNISEQIFNSITPPTNLLNSNRSLISNNEPQNVDEQNNLIEDEKSNQNFNSSCEDERDHSYYLIKKDNNLRAFIPEGKKQAPINETILMETKNMFEEAGNLQQKLFKKYKPLKVKRVKSDSSRQRKKIKILKKSQ